LVFEVLVYGTFSSAFIPVFRKRKIKSLVSCEYCS
jgi:peptidoglycan biosynthesis protein MviN/MurJ (putative lipid II flippase)